MLVGFAAQQLGPREEQQDHVFSEPGLHAVADGNGVMGDCSAKAVALFREHLHQHDLANAVRRTNEDLCAYLRAEVAKVLESWRGNERATEALEMLGAEFFQNELGSGSTLVAFVDDKHIVNVGDSRAYRVAPARNEVTLLTTDHVWTPDGDTVDVDGTIYKHGLAMARCLGHPQLHQFGVTAEPDVLPFELPVDEVLLLCSDGLRPFLEEHDGAAHLCKLLATKPLADVARLVIKEAAEVASDNVSLLLVGRA